MESKLKVCKNCGIEKEIDLFFNNYRMNDGKFSECKMCCKERYDNWRKNNPDKRAKTRKREYLKKHHRLTYGQYEEMMKSQGNLCYICACAAKITKDPRTKFLQVDHCHKTGKIRKLLCHQCNRALGLLKESKDLFLKCIDYLDEHS